MTLYPVAEPCNYPPKHEQVRCARCGGITNGLRLDGDRFVHRNPAICNRAQSYLDRLMAEQVGMMPVRRKSTPR